MTHPEFNLFLMQNLQLFYGVKKSQKSVKYPKGLDTSINKSNGC